MECSLDKILDTAKNFDITEHLDRRLVTVLALFGAYKLTRSSYYAATRVTKYCLLPRKDHYNIYGGGWVFVTGASDGLGKALANELASLKFNTILVARN